MSTKLDLDAIEARANGATVKADRAYLAGKIHARGSST